MIRERGTTWIAARESPPGRHSAMQLLLLQRAQIRSPAQALSKTAWHLRQARVLRLSR
jgi:hypothetical protein